MPEVLDEEDSGQLDLRGVVGIFRRRHLQFLLPLFLGWLIVWGVSWILPPTYKSTTTILVEQPTMPQNYVAPNISDDVQARIESMKTETVLRADTVGVVRAVGCKAGEMVEEGRELVDIEADE